ncbi:uncharacterized membrane protein YcgQ (UPF0703/DUF1980 family) [Pedobacter sp. UYP24]
MEKSKINIIATLTVLIILFLTSLPVLGQQRLHNSNDQIKSDNWATIGSIEFKTDDNMQIFGILNPTVKAYANKQFELEGYMIPVKEGMEHNRFMLSPLPINQCFFCGKNGVPIMVYIMLDKAMKFTDNTIKVKGILKLHAGNIMYTPTAMLTKAIVVN